MFYFLFIMGEVIVNICVYWEDLEVGGNLIMLEGEGRYVIVMFLSRREEVRIYVREKDWVL